VRKEVSYLLESITFQLSHTADGKPKVLILANDPYAIAVELGSLKTPPVYSAASATSIAVVEQPALTESLEAPICGVHQLPMQLMHGKRGGILSLP
jgi:hypothetical protein